MIDQNARLDQALKEGNIKSAEELQSSIAKVKDQIESSPDIDAQTRESAKTIGKDNAQKIDDAKSNIGCGGQANVCAFGGAFLASYSLTGAFGHRAGSTGHHVLQAILPTLGVRYAASEHWSFDAALYTAIISPQLQINEVSKTGAGCASRSTAFEDALPCEGNAVLRPYVGLLAGPTIGTGQSALGILTVGGTLGVARTSQDATGYFFAGLVIATGGIYATLPIHKTSSDSPKEAPGPDRPVVQGNADATPKPGMPSDAKSGAPQPASPAKPDANRKPASR